MNTTTHFFRSLLPVKPFNHKDVDAFMKYLDRMKGYPKNISICEPDENHICPAILNNTSGDVYERYELCVSERFPVIKEMIILSEYLKKKGLTWIIAKINLTKNDGTVATSPRVADFFNEQQLFSLWKSSFTFRLPLTGGTNALTNLNNFSFSPPPGPIITEVNGPTLQADN